MSLKILFVFYLLETDVTCIINVRVFNQMLLQIRLREKTLKIATLICETFNPMTFQQNICFVYAAKAFALYDFQR